MCRTSSLPSCSGLTLALGLWAVPFLAAHDGSHVPPSGTRGTPAWGCGTGRAPWPGEICAQHCPTSEQLREDLTHLVLTQQPCWALPAPSQCHWDQALPCPGDSPGCQPREHHPQATPGVSLDTAHSSLPFSKTKEDGSGVNPCWVLN